MLEVKILDRLQNFSNMRNKLCILN